MSDSASSGYSGPKIKSDCMITYTKSSGPLSISVTGEGETAPLEQAVESTAERLSISTGEVTIENCGASPFAASARFETAARKVMGDRLPKLPPASEFSESERNRPRRSRLYVPGNRPRFIEKALDSGADGLILDLEDSISPDRKFEARIMVAHALASIDFGDMEVMVRINQGQLGQEDLEWIVPQPVQHILIPKVEIPHQVTEVRDGVRRISEECGRSSALWLMPIIESPLGVFNALDIARAVPEEMAALTLGLQDLSAEMGVRPTVQGTESFTARSLIVMAARAAGLQPIDTVYADVKNEEGLRESVRRARELGFVGKGCIHPSQVDAINEGFLPDSESVSKAKKIVMAMERAAEEGLGAVALGSKMIDPPVARQAQTIVDNAVRLGLISIDWRNEENEK
jgi:citrate lyase subunit beta / citryl-CoA lyase